MSDIDQIVLDVARRFTEDGDALGRAQLQAAIADAIRAGQQPFPLVDLLDIRNQLHVMATTVVPKLLRHGRRAAGPGAGADRRAPPCASRGALVKPGRNRKRGTGVPALGADLLAAETSSGRLDGSHIGVTFITLDKTFDSLDRFSHRGLFGIKDAVGGGRLQLLVVNDRDDCLDPGVTLSPDPEADDVLSAGGFTGAGDKFVGFDRAHLEAPLGVPEAYIARCEGRSSRLAGVTPGAAEPCSIPKAAFELAALSCVDLAEACSRTVRLWEARALGLYHLAAGDMDEALKVMAAAQATVRRSRTPNPNQPRDAAKETR